MTQQVGMIVGCDVNGLIGYDGQLAYNNKTDLKRFKKLTMGSTVIVGRKTYDSLPVGKKTGKKLNGRIKHVLSNRASKYDNTEDTKYFNTFKDALLACYEDRPIWIIGGESLYKDSLVLSIPDIIDLTIINGMNIFSTQDSLATSMKKSSYLHPIPYVYMVESEVQNKDDDSLWHRRYVRRPGWGDSILKELRK